MKTGKMIDPKLIDKDWTLFLDRDGVINKEKYEDYIYNFDEFQFLPGVKESLKILSGIFSTIILVTNQRGVGRGLMLEKDLIKLQAEMMKEIREAGGRIDRIYYCTANDNAHPNRKPNPGMAFEAKKDLPYIDFKKSIMVGNTLSDMQFGKNAGMYTVHVRTTHPQITNPHSLIDLSCADLAEFTKWCSAVQER